MISVDEELKNSHSSRKIRGLRLKALRKSLSLSRSEFAEKLGVSAYTVQNWEINKNNGLSEERTNYVSQQLNGMGIHCSFEWMMYGIGLAPMIADPVSGEVVLNQALTSFDSKHEKDELHLIAKELALFHEHYQEKTLDCIIQDESMLPRYSVGEYVAGVSQPITHSDSVIGLDCIVQLENGEFLVRTVKKGTVPDRFILSSTNLDYIDKNAFLYDVKLLTLAPILWTRKRISTANPEE